MLVRMENKAMGKGAAAKGFCASFFAAASLNSSLGAVRRLMLLFPETRPVAEGLTLKFIVGNSLLEFRKEGITYTYYFEIATKKGTATNLIRFLSILAYLKAVYEVRIDSFYGPIMETINDSLFLAREDDSGGGQADARISELSKSNAAISKEAIALSRRKEKLEREGAILKRFALVVIEKLSQGGPLIVGMKEAVSRMGIPEPLCSEVIEILSKSNSD